jgi:hypothetical protein
VASGEEKLENGDLKIGDLRGWSRLLGGFRSGTVETLAEEPKSNSVGVKAHW